MPDVHNLKGDIGLSSLAGLESCQRGKSCGSQGRGTVGAAGVDEGVDAVGVVGEICGEVGGGGGVGVVCYEVAEVVGYAEGGAV